MCFYKQKVISGEETGDLHASSPPKFEIFFLFPNLLRSEILATPEATPEASHIQSWLYQISSSPFAFDESKLHWNTVNCQNIVSMTVDTRYNLRFIWVKIFKSWSSKVCGRQLLNNLKRYGLLKADRTPSNFLKAVFHNFFLFHSWILCPIYVICIANQMFGFYLKRNTEMK